MAGSITNICLLYFPICKEEKLLKKLKNLDLYIGAISFVVMVLLIVINVILRYIFRMGISWAEELTLILFTWSTYFGIVAAARYDKHVKVDILYNMFPKVVQKTIDIITEIGIVVLSGYLTYLSIIMCLNVGSKRTLVMRLPANIVNSSLIVSFAMITIWTIIQMVQKIKGTYVLEDPLEDALEDIDD